MKAICLRRAALMATVAGAISAAPIAHADGDATVFQYELGLGGKQPVSTFYLSYQSSHADSIALSDGDGQSALRMPLYSTDPNMRTSFKQFDMLMSASEDEDLSVGDSLGILMFVAMLGGGIYAIAQQLSEAGDFNLGVPTPPQNPPPAADKSQ